jgi:hypothetical protein
MLTASARSEAAHATGNRFDDGHRDGPGTRTDVDEVPLGPGTRPGRSAKPRTG